MTCGPTTSDDTGEIEAALVGVGLDAGEVAPELVGTAVGVAVALGAVLEPDPAATGVGEAVALPDVAPDPLLDPFPPLEPVDATPPGTDVPPPEQAVKANVVATSKPATRSVRETELESMSTFSNNRAAIGKVLGGDSLCCEGSPITFSTRLSEV